MSFGCLGYKKTDLLILPEKNAPVLQRDIVLQADTAVLKEVRISAKAPPIKEKGDTTEYNPAAFSDGTEEVIEDLLRKLPGVEVGEDGSISYKGKSIDKVLVEGDDLFDKKYTLLTQNMTPEAIKKVQAIEHYVENKLLKGIEKSDAVVLNLELKEEAKMRPYGNVSAGYGERGRYDLGTNLIVFSKDKKSKTFSFGSSNNVGDNPNAYITPYGYNTESDFAHQSASLIHISPIIAPLKDERVNQNRSAFISTNFVRKIGEKIKATGYLYYHGDRIANQHSNQLTYLLPSNEWTLEERYRIEHRPKIGEGQLKLLYSPGDSSEWVYQGTFQRSTTRFLTDAFTQGMPMQETLDNRDHRMQHRLEFTRRLDARSVWRSTASYLRDKRPQEYIRSPEWEWDSTASSALPYINLQLSQSAAHRYAAGTQYLRTHKNGNYSILARYEHIRESLSTRLRYFQEDIYTEAGKDWQNDHRYQKRDYALGLAYQYLQNRFSASARLQLHALHVGLNNLHAETLVNEYLYYPSPSISLNYKTGRHNQLGVSYLYDLNISGISDMYPGYVWTHYRTFSRGLPLGASFPSHFVMASFVHADIAKQLMLVSSFLYNAREQSYAKEITLNRNYAYSRETLQDLGTKNYTLGFSADKFIPLLSSTLKIKLNANRFEYPNIINASGLRHNISQSTTWEVYGRTAFDAPFNFTIVGKYRHAMTESPASQNHNKNALTRLRTVIKPDKRKRWVFSAISEYLWYNIQKNAEDTYFYLDVSIRYIAIKNKLTYVLSGNNLSNNRTFIINAIEDYYVQREMIRLTPRYIMLQVQYRL